MGEVERAECLCERGREGLMWERQRGLSVGEVERVERGRGREGWLWER